MVIMSAICPLWVKKLGCRCKSVLGGVFEWLTIACRIGVPAGLTMIGAWMNEYCLLLKKLIDSKPTEWFALWGCYDHKWKVFFAFGVMALIAFQIISEIILFRRNRCSKARITELEDKLSNQSKELEEAKLLKDNISSIVKLYLSATSKALKMGTEERISFYKLNPDGKSFSILARDSENTDLRTYKRDTFDIEEGIIGLARTSGHAFVGGLPNYKKAPKNYINVCKEKFDGITATRIKSLTMKAQLYYAFRFSAHDHLDFNSVVVVESMNPMFKTEQELQDVFSPDNEFVYMLVKNFGNYMSTPDIAKKENL